MQFSAQGKPPTGIIYDTGLSRVSDVLAMAMLYGFDGKNEARVVAVSVSKSNLAAAAFCEVVGQFYSGAVSGAFGGFGRTLPVGLSIAGKLPEDSPMLTAPLARMDAEGKPVYRHTIHKLNDTADPSPVIRNALTAQRDENAIVVLSGPATNLAQLLALRDIKDWITRKVKVLVVAAGAYPEGAPDLYLQTDVPAARKVFAEWPTPIVACGAEVGTSLLFPAASLEKDFAWSPAHPVVDAYRAYRAMPYDAPSESMAAALYAARSQEGYFRLSEPGTITVTAGGASKFTPTPEGRHRFLMVNPEQKDRILKTYVEIASAKPVPRTRFPRPPQQQQQQQQNQQPPPPIKPVN